MPKKVIIYTDGASQGNPGPSGIGVIICNAKEEAIKNISEAIGQTTNNVAEYTALIYALQESLILGAKEVIIKTDSELLVKQLNRIYKVKDTDLKLLFNQLQHLKNKFSRFEIKHINRKENIGADKLAAKALKKTKIAIGLPKAKDFSSQKFFDF